MYTCGIYNVTVDRACMTHRIGTRLVRNQSGSKGRGTADSTLTCQFVLVKSLGPNKRGNENS